MTRRQKVTGFLATVPLTLLILMGGCPDEPPDPDPTTTSSSETTATSAPTTSIEPTTTESTTTTTEATTTTTEPPPTTGTTLGPPTVPFTCRPDSDNNGAVPRFGWPRDENTGPDGAVDAIDEDRLPSSGRTGTWTINTPGQIVDGVFHRGRIVVAAAGVTIRRSVICGTGLFIVQVQAGSVTIEDSILLGEVGTVQPGVEHGEPCQANVGYGNYTVRRTELQNCVDAFKATANVVVEESWVHDNYTNRGGSSGEPGAGTHNDTMQQTQGHLNLTFRGNAAYQDPCTSNRHFQMAPPNPGGSPTGSGGVWRIEDNFFYGIRIINVDRGVRVADGDMTDNVYAGTGQVGSSPTPFYAGDGMFTVFRSGNEFEDGTAANGEPPAGYTCSQQVE